MVQLTANDKERFKSEKILWLATVDSLNKPHLTPIWYIFHEEKIYLCTTKESIKHKNIQKNKVISFALEDGINPVCGLGECTVYKVDEFSNLEVINEFKEKFDWDITTDDDYTILIEIMMNKIFMRT
jgi:hypothetical protein